MITFINKLFPYLKADTTARTLSTYCFIITPCCPGFNLNLLWIKCTLLMIECTHINADTATDTFFRLINIRRVKTIIIKSDYDNSLATACSTNTAAVAILHCCNILHYLRFILLKI